MTSNISSSPEHDEVEQYKKSEASQEPESSDFNISLSIPQSIEIKMVDATSLSDYEIWFFGSGALLSVLSGFLVAYAQESKPEVQKILGIAALIFAFLFVLCFIMTLVKRNLVRKKGRTIRLKTSKLLEPKK